jgi:phosphopantothenoylcysteine synthetase/decarboxylase
VVTEKQRLAWAITGSGHYLRECIEIIHTLDDVDLFLSKAAAEVMQQYGYKHNVGKVFQDKTSSSVPVELFYKGRYHTLVIAPATSNTIAKMVYGISDNLVTNLYAQAGKTRVPSIIFACDTAPELESEAPRDHMVKVYPRQIDLDNIAKIKTYVDTHLVEDMQSLKDSVHARLQAVITKKS